MCDTMVIVEPDRVLFAKNSDRDPNEAQRLEWHPGRDHAPGSRVRCTWIEIPQVEHTHAVMLSRPFWIFGAEMGTNEHGVTIGNEAVFTREPVPDAGLTGMDLIRLALERADTAASAVETIRTLIATHGQGGAGGLENRRFAYFSSFLVADPREAYVLETAGRDAAVEKVQHARSISNRLTIPGFAETHTKQLESWASHAADRCARSTVLLGDVRGPMDLARILRDHGIGRNEPRYSLLFGSIDSVCMHAGGVAAASQTTGSWISELRSNGSKHWATGTAAPCTGLFKPVSVSSPIDVGAPDDHDDGASLWWRHERLHRAVMRDPARLGAMYFAERDALERAWFTEPPASREAFREGDRLLATWTERAERERVRDRRPPWVRRYWQVRARWAVENTRMM